MLWFLKGRRRRRNHQFTTFADKWHEHVLQYWCSWKLRNVIFFMVVLHIFLSFRAVFCLLEVMDSEAFLCKLNHNSMEALWFLLLSLEWLFFFFILFPCPFLLVFSLLYSTIICFMLIDLVRHHLDLPIPLERDVMRTNINELIINGNKFLRKWVDLPKRLPKNKNYTSTKLEKVTEINRMKNTVRGN